MTATAAPVAPAPVVETRPAADLLALLEDALTLVAQDDDLDRFAARTPAGTALTSLSAIARRAAAVLGAGSTAHLTEGSGVVVVRDLVVATRLLARAMATRPHGNAPDVEPLHDAAGGVHATLRDLLTTTA